MLKVSSLTLLLFLFSTNLIAQKKPLDHSVYDQWENIGEKQISPDGKWIVYSVNRQEGDDRLVVQTPAGAIRREIPRGAAASITRDSRFLICRIQPFYTAIREAKIKKKKPEDFPKDSLMILDLKMDTVRVIPEIKSYAVPDEASDWVAYLVTVKEAKKNKSESAANSRTDSLEKIIDSLRIQLQETAPAKKKKKKREDFLNDNLASDQFFDFADSRDIKEGDMLILFNALTGTEMHFPYVQQYQFSKTGNRLVYQSTANKADTNSVAAVILVNLEHGTKDTVMKGGNDFKQMSFSDDGRRLAFVAERDSSAKALQKFYKLWYYADGLDTAMMLVSKNSVGMHLGMTVSENGRVSFSKSGNRLIFGVAEIRAPADTSMPAIDKVDLDIWNYKDDYLQPYQLKNLNRELNRSYLTVYDFSLDAIHQLASPAIPTVVLAEDGDADWALGMSDEGKRIEFQWMGSTRKDIYSISMRDAGKKKIKENLSGWAQISSTGKYIVWYDNELKNYFSWNGEKVNKISGSVTTPLYDEENDIPTDPDSYGLMGWLKDDESLLVYDRYDIWQLDPRGIGKAYNLTNGAGRKIKTAYRYINLDREEDFIDPSKPILLSTFSDVNKHSGIAKLMLGKDSMPTLIMGGAYRLSRLEKADSSDVFAYIKETYQQSPDIYAADNFLFERKLSALNPQQSDYNWGTAELYRWKTFDGKESTGLLYKPENFDSTKKYPMLIYFYETLSDRLYNYIPPAPTPSRLDITFFVSRGYLVFTPDIHYGTGHPGKDAYNYIVSGAQALAKLPWVDGKNIGIQGQSWGGYQVAYLITATDMFKAAWAGAPVANMTSAYGGIRWGSGMNRQFQYERTQSRIGATLWEKPELYIENSPLFHLPNVKTPLVIMHNDEDGAVPWYQGIELFTAMKRLNKPVWLLVYNGEDHNVVQRKNRKDLSIREQQFFDWMLKGDLAPKWITEGVPATMKGKDMGLGF